MSRNPLPNFTPIDVLRILRDHPRRWVMPTVALTLLAAAYAQFRPVTWDASQALMVRDEAISTAARPGKFQQLDDMKAVQETILELARSRTVLGEALAEVGPDVQHNIARPWPSEVAIADLQSRVKLSPPKGAEFGKTEVFYLDVEAESRERAVALATAICKQLQARSQQLRDQKAQSLIAELTKTVELAQAELAAITTKLTATESKVGADLGELRSLNDASAGDNPLRRSINEMEQELRQAQQAIDANQQLLSLLEASKIDARSLVAAPNRLLEAQPVLRRLKDGLVDAQLRTAQLSGNMTADHPLVKAAKISEQKIADHVHGELDSAFRGVQVELRLSQQRADELETQLANVRSRLTRLADMRAEYANVVAQRNHRAEILKTADQHLAEARASQAAAGTASLIAALDAPVAGNAPVGPGKLAIVLGGLLGGLVLGLGIVFLSVQPIQSVSVVPQTPDHAASHGSMNGHAVNGHANGHVANGSSLSLKQALRKLTAAG